MSIINRNEVNKLLKEVFIKYNKLIVNPKKEIENWKNYGRYETCSLCYEFNVFTRWDAFDTIKCKGCPFCSHIPLYDRGGLLELKNEYSGYIGCSGYNDSQDTYGKLLECINEYVYIKISNRFNNNNIIDNYDFNNIIRCAKNRLDFLKQLSKRNNYN